MSPAPHYHPEAYRDVIHAADYIAKDSLDAALRFYDAVDAAARDLAAMPGMGPAYEFQHAALQDVRFWPIKGFRNYLMFYRPLAGGGVEIIRVLHGAMNVERELEP